jgi:hypothetical protein
MKIANTFITVADDCPASHGAPPPMRDGVPSLARLHYDLLTTQPYAYDIDALNFKVWRLRNGVSEADADQHRAAFFSKGHPCMRASPLTKRYGFGAHYDGAGKIAVYPVKSAAYDELLNAPGNKVEKAMRNKRAPTSAQPAGARPRLRP